PVPEAAGYVLDAAEALAEAHALGIVHRDVKPANLILARDERGAVTVKLVDFGISKITSAAAASITLDATGAAVLGSPRYMAPEQLSSPAEVDARADVWALGVTLYELVTGRPPFSGASLIDLSVKIFHDPPAPLDADVAPAVGVVVDRCLRKRREQRFPDAAGFAAALRASLDSPPGPRPRPRRVRWVVLAGLAALTALASVASR